MADNGGYIGRNPGDASVTIARQTYEPSGVTTEFTFDSGYTPGYMDVYLNGVRLVEGLDYGASNGTSVGLSSAAEGGDVLECVAYKKFNLGQTIDQITGPLTLDGKLTVSGISSLTDVVSSGIVTADSFSGGWSGALSITDTTAATSTSTGALIISGGVGIAKSLFVGEGVSIAGTITYDDVTNIDSVGIVTAGKGFKATTGGVTVLAGNSVLGAGLSVAGITTLGAVGASGTTIHVHGDARITGVLTATTFVGNVTGDLTGDVTGNVTGSASTAAVPGISTQLHSVFGTINASGIVTASALTATNSSTLSGGIVVGTAASVHSPGTNFLSLGTNNVGVVSLTAQSGVLFKNGLLVERVDRNTSAAANAATALNMDNGMIHWFTTNLGAANVKMNLTSAVGINSTLAVGDMISVTIMTKVNSASNFIEQLRVDGVEATAGVTTYWTGGSAPTDGGGSGVDTYLFNIVKTGSGTYDMVANQVKGS